MQHYCGIDLHSNNHVVVVIDEEDKRVFEKRLSNDLSLTLQALSPYQESLQGIAVESTFNGYWLVDGLQAHGYCLQLVNTAAVTQYDELKYSGGHHDAFHLAHLLRLGILPAGHIYPKEQRAIRDLLRRRLSLVRAASTQLISVQSQIWRCTEIRVKSERLRRADFEPPQMDSYTLQAVQAGLAVYHAMQAEIDVLEQSAHQAVKLSKEFEILQTIRGIGKILGLTSCWKQETSIVLPVRVSLPPIVAVSIAYAPATEKRKDQAMLKQATPVFPGPRAIALKSA